MLTPETRQYCLSLAKAHAPDLVLASLYTPSACRDALMVLLALDAEFTHIRHATSEELIAHMRYAWWQDALEQTYEGKPPAGHVVLQAWHDVGLPVVQESILGLHHHHRSHYPELPTDATVQLEMRAGAVVQTHGAGAGWGKAQRIISAHRGRHGAGKDGLLQMKLLVKGLGKAA